MYISGDYVRPLSWNLYLALDMVVTNFVAWGINSSAIVRFASVTGHHVSSVGRSGPWLWSGGEDRGTKGQGYGMSGIQ